MLNFTRPTSTASATDLVWPFQGRHLVSELMGSPGAPIPLGQLMTTSNSDRYHACRLS